MTTPISQIFNVTSKGSKYFHSKEHADADPKEYVISRGSDAKHHPSDVAKEWNGFMSKLKHCDDSHWREYARSAPDLTKGLVLLYSEYIEGIEGLGPDVTGSNENGVNDETTSSSIESTQSSVSSTSSKSSRLRREGSTRSTRSTKRKKLSFSIYFKEPSDMDDDDEWLEVSNPSTNFSMKHPHSKEDLMDYMHGLYGGSIERKETLYILQRLVMILPSRFTPEEEYGETGFISAHLQCFLDVLFGPRCKFCIKYNIEHDSGNAIKSEHDHGVRSDFFIEVPCPTLSSFSNSEIVGVFGEVKPPEKDRKKNIRIQDFWKLNRMAKDELNSQISKGVLRPMVILIQVFGFQIDMYIMTMDPNDGLYVLYKAAEYFLPRSLSDMSGVSDVISIFMHSKKLLNEFQDQLNETKPYTGDIKNPPELQKFVKGDIIFLNNTPE
ncbi:hypothetical protein BGZ76_010443 [Entomortierella beljakovae]|nr:hypothetical protein BGZ76_010443 [Entomortierella beljakovae]